MAIVHIAVLTAALLTLLCLPCVVAAVVCADVLAERPWTRDGRRRIRALRRLDRALCRLDPTLCTDDPTLCTDDPTQSPARLDRPSIEQLAFDLRRLARQRHSGPTQHSEKWLAAVQRAYDDRLRLACQCLGLDEHLDPLQGMDRDLERLRMEHVLQAAGLALH
ncbi:hypothetical protein GCM10010172_00330 [Paractinoplanes ferrugineus]|uniref:Secreted protein n=1 Tax=Paractinoplanes ferrugineus TaxID=113564 RepID=A0A919MGI0_9ACTN|nr:hypothetical protein [Actinoplanes ferrugineus]GIE13879.1 hypothetical protein Afe05nite_57190 [Actinoplanes ferrugineus]